MQRDSDVSWDMLALAETRNVLLPMLLSDGVRLEGAGIDIVETG